MLFISRIFNWQYTHFQRISFKWPKDLHSSLGRKNNLGFNKVTKTDLIEEIRNLRKQLIEARQNHALDSAGYNRSPEKFSIHENEVFFDFMETIPILVYVFKGDKFVKLEQ